MSELNLDELTRQIAAGYGISLSHQEALIAAARKGALWDKEGWQDLDVLRSDLTTLRAQLAEAREALTGSADALESFAVEASKIDPDEGDDSWCDSLLVSDLRRAFSAHREARSVLAKLQPSGETI